jgi:hypothetical protein
VAWSAPSTVPLAGSSMVDAAVPTAPRNVRIQA